MVRLSEVLKYDLAIAPEELAATDDAGSPWFTLGSQKHGAFVVAASCEDGLDDTHFIYMELQQNTTPVTTLVADVNIVGCEQATVAFIDIGAAPADGDTVIVNGRAFVRDGTFPALGDWGDAGELAVAITGAGLGLTATEAGDELTITSTIPGREAVTISAPVAVGIASDPVTLEAVAYIDLDGKHIDSTANAVSLLIHNTAGNPDVVVSAVMVGGLNYHQPVRQAVAASALTTV